MDRSTLHELDSREREREGIEDGDDIKGRTFGRSTRTSRRVPTGTDRPSAEEEQRGFLAAEDDAGDCDNDEGKPSAAMPSRQSLAVRNSSWDEELSEVDGMRMRSGSPKRGGRASLEVSTPTLIDEPDFVDEEEEQEMISLERERITRNSRSLFPQDESSIRRTPGAQMYRSSIDNESMRRTPGASQMHRSTVGQVLQQEPGAGNVSGLGFGLTLSTPVAAAKPRSLNLATAWEASPSADKDKSTIDQSNKPPLPPGSGSRDQRAAFVGPWNIAKTSSQRRDGHGSYSPNTLRLTEDLGNLLFEEDTDTHSPNIVFGSPKSREIESQGQSQGQGQATTDTTESWTAPYVISMDAPSRVPRSSGNRGRRGKGDGSRRSRAQDRSNTSMTRHLQEQGTMKTGGFLQYAQQPKPVRSSQPPAFGPMFTPSPMASGNLSSHGLSTEGRAAPDQDGAQAPRLLNFGGAFAPPSKSNESSLHRPVPSSSPQQIPGGNAGAHPNFSGAMPTLGAPNFHNPFQVQGQPHFMPQQPKFQPQFAPPAAAAANYNADHGAGMQRPTFNFGPSNMGYPMHAGVPPAPQDFVPNMQVMHQLPRVQVPQLTPPPQVWPPSMEVPYEGMATPPPQMDQRNWHVAPGHGGWPMGNYSYGMPRTAHSPVFPVAQAQGWGTEPDLVPTAPHTSHYPIAAQSPQPSAPSPGPTATKSKKGQRKGNKKGAKPSTKTEKAQKSDATSSNASSGKRTPTLKKGKKKQGKDRSTPTTQAKSFSPTEEIVKAGTEDGADSKRTEPQETPALRTAFKDFYRKFRAEERNSFGEAEQFALRALTDGTLPKAIHWKVYLELADLAKRANRFGEARKLYEKVCQLQPNASQGWLEFSKLEEECGNMVVCTRILRTGLEKCQYNENLLTRAIKHEEKMGNLNRAREFLSRLKHVGIEKVWRTVLEGALLEARAGNDIMARRVLKYLMHHVPWYGPLYLEAYKLEKDLGRAQEAYEVVERGLAAIPRYGPLWFGAFRLCEELDIVAHRYMLPQSMTMIDRATSSISKELIWKVHLEAAQMLERAAIQYLDSNTDPTAQDILDLSRKRFAMTIFSCPPNLRWKVWLASGRMEVAAGNSDRARKLFLRAHKVVPDKGRAVALLECARLEEFVGDVDLAKAILCQSRNVRGSDWKVWLESVLLEIRCGNRPRAIELAKLALQLHSGTGRLWASLVHLHHFKEGEAAQFESLKKALNAVPKSGEVWCEGARIHLNPFSCSFDISSARKHLAFATKFTPQYGDGFLETLKLEILDQWLVPISKLIWETTRKQFVIEGMEKDVAMKKYVSSISSTILNLCSGQVGDKLGDENIDNGTAGIIRSSLEPAFRDKIVDISRLRQDCSNADPNYGSLWFFCREALTGTARMVLNKAVELMKQEIRDCAHIYLAALIRRHAILARIDFELETMAEFSKIPNEKDTRKNRSIQNTPKWESLLTDAFFSAPSLENIFEDDTAKPKSTTDVDLVESTMSSSNFVCGLVALSLQKSIDELSQSDRRKALFGTDALFA